MDLCNKSIQFTYRLGLRLPDKPPIVFYCRCDGRRYIHVFTMPPPSPTYTVHWESDHLGVWLQEDPTSGAAVISKLVRPLPPHFAQLDASEGSVGDVLYSVEAEQRSGPIPYNDAIAILQHPKLPLYLVFRNRRNDTPMYVAPPLATARRYSFEWTVDMKPLGISFAKDPITLVTNVSNINEAVLPPALKNCHPRVGDIVVSIGDTVVTEMKFHDVLAMLGHVEKPIVLAFEQAQLNTASIDGGYDIKYHGERLGLVFEKHGDSDRPVVTKTTGAQPMAQVGDELVAIDGVDTKSLGFDQAMAKLHHVDGTLRLSFTVAPRPPSVVDDRGEYDVHYLGGRLGLVLVEGRTKSSHPLIDQVTDASTSVGLELASKGDILLSVGGVDTATLGFAKTVAMIKQVNSLVVLRFQKAGSVRTETTAAGLLLTMVEALFI
ncbi:hypothetical protein DYB32_002494 [Aphanomyces invadans]|uniref:PDZ domain-containing protein n=1 Tax=Aphanomyces invadans TaxID=157072 RepID=A0A3R6VQD3_9STRA|nr:hypothetical protein DYB32_002494 [Aphanomyces invadans]